jgi:hypothetical protein
VAELIPLVGGSLVGLALAWRGSLGLRLAVLAVASLLLAIVAGVVSGELAESGWFLLWDSAQAVAAGALAMVAARLVRSNRAAGRAASDS